MYTRGRRETCCFNCHINRIIEKCICRLTISFDNTSTTVPQSIDEPSHTRRSRGRSTQRKTSQDVGVDRKPATKRHVVERVEHEVGRDRRAPAIALAAAEQAPASAVNDDDDDDNNNGDGRNRQGIMQIGVVRGSYRSDLCLVEILKSSASITPQLQMKATTTDDDDNNDDQARRATFNAGHDLDFPPAVARYKDPGDEPKC